MPQDWLQTNFQKTRKYKINRYKNLSNKADNVSNYILKYLGQNVTPIS